MKPLLARILCTAALAGCSQSRVAPVATADTTACPDAVADVPPDIAPDATPDSADATADATPLPAAITPGELIDRLADAYCAVRVQCSGAHGLFLGDDGVAWRGVPCGNRLRTRENTLNLRQRLRLVELHRVAFDGVAAAACIAAMDCSGRLPDDYVGGPRIDDPRYPIPEACSRVFVGALPAGQRCADDVECASGRCWGCPGVCTAPAATGAACGRNVACSKHDVCFAGHCRAFTAATQGETCGLPNILDDGSAYAIDDTETFIPCAAALGCYGPPVNGYATCIPLPTLGQPCGAGACFPSDLGCANGLCAPVATGGPCGAGCTADPCSGIQCAGDSNCTFASSDNHPTQYICWPTASPSMPCGEVMCPPSEHCVDSVTGSCALPKPDGYPCKFELDMCEHICDTTLKKCGQWPVCKEPSCAHCNASGFGCLLRRVGDSCVANADCDPDGYMNGVHTVGCVQGQCERINAACGWPENTP